MNKTELRKIMSNFNSLSNRLIQAAYDDYIDVLKKFINYIESNELINGFIIECGGFNPQIEDELNQVISRNCCLKFSIDDKEEVVEIYSIIKILCNRDYEHLPFGLLFSYSSSNNFADKLKGFNHRVVLILINHINDYLKKVGIDMGLDDNVTYNINGTQVNIANDNAYINAVQNNGIDGDKLKELITAMRNSFSAELTADDKQDANTSIDIIERELQSGNPNEEIVKTHFKLLNRIDKGLKFATSCCSLLTFADKIYPFLDQIIPWFQSLI